MEENHVVVEMGKTLPRKVTRLLTGSVVVVMLASWGEAQQTVFNVPSADVLERGKVYAEADLSYQQSQLNLNIVPRVVYGTGHGLEVGLNIPTFATQGNSTIAISPTFKWRIFTKDNWTVFVGDNIFIPIRMRSYGIGNYAYAAAAKQWHTNTRIVAGGFHFSPHVVDSHQKAGGQFSFEQTIDKRMTVAADWFTGSHSNGYITAGLIYKASSRFTIYPAYEMGNSGLRRGNHLLLVEVGWNLN